MEGVGRLPLACVLSLQRGCACRNLDGQPVYYNAHCGCIAHNFVGLMGSFLPERSLEEGEEGDSVRLVLLLPVVFLRHYRPHLCCIQQGIDFPIGRENGRNL